MNEYVISSHLVKMVQGEVLLVLFRHRAIDFVGALAPRIIQRGVVTSRAEVQRSAMVKKRLNDTHVATFGSDYQCRVAFGSPWCVPGARFVKASGSAPALRRIRVASSSPALAARCSFAARRSLVSIMSSTRVAWTVRSRAMKTKLLGPIGLALGAVLAEFN